MFNLISEICRETWQHLTFREGKRSKTALWLTIYLAGGFILWLTLSLFAGNTLFGWWYVPEFNETAFAAVGSVVGGLYFANHNLTKWKVTDLQRPGKPNPPENTIDPTTPEEPEEETK